MDRATQLKRGISRQLSTNSVKQLTSKLSFRRQNSLDPRSNNNNNGRFGFGRQSSLDPIQRAPVNKDDDELAAVPGNLDSTMQLLFVACKGDVQGVKELLDDGVDVNSIDLDGRTALHVAACEGHVDVVLLLLRCKANIDARDRWGSTAAADAKYYGHIETYDILKARGAKVPKTRKTPMSVAHPREVPEYELNPHDLQIRKGDGISKGAYQVGKWNGTKVSVKILDKDCSSDPESVNAFKHELTLLEKVRHPNVVQFVGAVTQRVPMMIVSEHHPGGDLRTYLQNNGRLSLSKALKFALDIARGMNYLHECKPDPIIHCDLKPKNIFLDIGGQLKVAGFGLIRLSKVSPNKARLARPDTIDPTNLYVAPEIYNDELFDRRVDAYSFGLILYEMIEGVQPFHPKVPEEAIKLLCVANKRPPFKIKCKYYPPDLKELLEECWYPDLAIRPHFHEIIIRLDKIVKNCSKHGRWKDTFKLPWL
ncbi:putative dual-specificity kinase TKL-Pl-5 family [Helianthus annuus]|uniref:non-specific serine/threonine protein kinase n=1 Tax=Helianthus annuus TaxID=4232 RepID=A0A251TBM2_HELAN|nr:integrin-linked protein kinase 1 isoform X1 [Helianthus annuus]KAF5783112.1 putative dual-specificity kinase TKL-Pl-5 family [Helianthus annuus]